MYEKIIFYNHFGYGDLFNSREFVKELMKLLPADMYFYAHNKNKRTLEDIENLKYIPLRSMPLYFKIIASYLMFCPILRTFSSSRIPFSISITLFLASCFGAPMYI